MSKKDFLIRCGELGIPLNNAIQAWDKLQNLERHITKNWKLFEIMQKYSKNEKLKLREYAAEQGFEYTPAELDELIEIIGIIQENIKNK